MAKEIAAADEQLVKDALEAMSQALKDFGTYSFDDKGPVEVMDIDELVPRFRKLKVEVAAKTIAAIGKSKKCQGRGQRVAGELLYQMQDWDELFEYEEASKYL